jgi:hypothetical protein
VMTMGGGRLLVGSGFSAASQSLVGPLPGTASGLTVTSVRWGNESWTRLVRGFPERTLHNGAARLNGKTGGRAADLF